MFETLFSNFKVQISNLQVDLYSEIILDHYKQPRNTGKLDQPTHQAVEVNSFCGDAISVQLLIANYKPCLPAGRLQEIKYQATGCAISVASASILSEYLIGKN